MKKIKLKMPLNISNITITSDFAVVNDDQTYRTIIHNHPVFVLSFNFNRKVGGGYIEIDYEDERRVLRFLSKQSIATRLKIGFALIESGHLAQNILLVSESMNLNVVGLGGYHDKGLAKLINANYQSEKIIYVMAMGKP